MASTQVCCIHHLLYLVIFQTVRHIHKYKKASSTRNAVAIGATRTTRQVMYYSIVYYSIVDTFIPYNIVIFNETSFQFD